MLLDVRPEELPDTLGQFQCTRFDHDDVLQLLLSLNALGEADAVLEEQLRASFTVDWPQLDRDVRAAMNSAQAKVTKQPTAPVMQFRVTTAGEARLQLSMDQLQLLHVVANQPPRKYSFQDIARIMNCSVVRVEAAKDALTGVGLVEVYADSLGEERVVLSRTGRRVAVDLDMVD